MSKVLQNFQHPRWWRRLGKALPNMMKALQGLEPEASRGVGQDQKTCKGYCISTSQFSL